MSEIVSSFRILNQITSTYPSISVYVLRVERKLIYPFFWWFNFLSEISRDLHTMDVIGAHEKISKKDALSFCTMSYVAFM